MTAAASGRSGDDSAALVVILAGVAAALHIGKLPPALPVLRASLGLSLVEAGFMLSLVQFAGMSLGLVVGLAADAFGLRRGMTLGLLTLGTASIAGGWARSPAMLLALRGFEGLGFLLTVTPAPSLIRRLVGARSDRSLGLWGAYMPLGTGLALLGAPYVIDLSGWPSWWWLLGGLALLMAAALLLIVPPDPAPPAAADDPSGATAGAPAADRMRDRALLTLGSAGPWSLGLSFTAYAGQWIAVLGFLPTVYAQAGVAPAHAGQLTALVAAVNMTGNIVAGRLMHRGVPGPRLLQIGFGAMAIGAMVAYQPVLDGFPTLRYLGFVLFSAAGGLVPATLFSLAVRLAPEARVVSTTVGWMQQCSALGQFATPPLVAWVAHRFGGWSWTPAVTATMAVAGLALSVWIARLLVARAGR